MNDEKFQLKEKIENNETVQKGKRGILRLLFSRTALLILLLLLQIAFIVSGYVYLAGKWYFVDGIVTLLSFILVVFIMNGRDNPAFKLVWIIVILALPIFGTPLYLFVEFQLGSKWTNSRLQKMHQYSQKYWSQDQEVLANLEKEDPKMARLVNYVNRYGGFPVYQNTEVTYFASGEEKFERLQEELKKAKHFIFMEYFIVAKGYMWDTILEILKAKVKEGVEVRFMYDGMNSLSTLPYKYPEQLEAYGIRCHVFAPIRPALSTQQNNRDHRKIVVVDGRVAFTGGINLADEYINRKERFGHWKDTAIMVEGDAVRSFTLMFLEMWNVHKDISRKPIQPFDKYLDVVQERTPTEEDGFVIPYGDSPLDHEIVGEQVYIDILYTAENYVHIMTPYLILGNEMIIALTYAAKRGVDVKIIMPHIPDKWYAFVLAKTYYDELLDAGVEIYEYIPGFVHAKSFTSDDEKAVVGTINLDFRSLYLHFECAALFYKNKEVAKVEDDFQATLGKCVKVTREDFSSQPLFNRLAGHVLRLLAPLM